MELAFSLDLILFFFLFALFVYVIATVTITNLHKVYLVFHVTMMLWPFFQFIIMTLENEKHEMYFLKAAFVDVSLMVVGWLVFTIFLVGRSSFLRRKISLAIYIPAFIAIIGVIINPNDIFVIIFEENSIRRSYGILFVYIMTILLGYLLASLYVIYRTLRSTSVTRIHRQVKQVLKGILVLFFFSLLDILLNVVFAQWLPIIPGLTSLGILLSATFFVIAIQNDKVLDIVTIAHQDIIDSINHGILVLDENETIVEVNKALRSHSDWHIGDRFNMDTFLLTMKTLNRTKSFLEAYRSYPLEKLEFVFILDDKDQQHISIHVAPIIVNDTMIGRNITFQDISEVQRLIEQTNLQNETLQQQNQALIAIKDELCQSNLKLEHMVITDSLLGCYNRHYLTLHLEQEIMKNMSNQIPFAIILLDIDYFKLVNDQYGHLVGDEVLCSMVDTINQTLRRTDVLARYGGEEFMIYLPHTNESDASILAENIMLVIESKRIIAEDRAYSLSITVSMGLLSVYNDSRDIVENPTLYLKEMLVSVDEALYEAKKEGRNRVVSRMF